MAATVLTGRDEAVTKALKMSFERARKHIPLGSGFSGVHVEETVYKKLWRRTSVFQTGHTDSWHACGCMGEWMR